MNFNSPRVSPGGGASGHYSEETPMEDEHEVYGGDIPEEVEGDIEIGLDGEAEELVLKGDDIGTDEAASKVIIVLCWLFNWCAFVCRRDVI